MILSFRFSLLISILALTAPSSLFAHEASRAAPPAAHNPDQASKEEHEDEFSTSDVFGFTSGSDVGEVGEKAIGLETSTDARVRYGSYHATDGALTFSAVPLPHFTYEVALHGAYAHIQNNPDYAAKDQLRFSGLSTKVSYQFLQRGVNSPLGLSLSIEPEWSFVEAATGERVHAYGAELRLNADAELIPKKLYAAFNLFYSPEVGRPLGEPAWEHRATIGFSGALAYRITPTLALGAGIEYDRAYEGLDLHRFMGHAIYAGPSLHWEVSHQFAVSAAWYVQVAGRARSESYNLDLTNFSKQRVQLKAEMSF